MASYVSPNYNPAYYELPTFEAPTDTAFRVAQQKQVLFDQGLKQVQQEFQANLNIPVISQYNKERRDVFMKEAEQKLRNIATADFSLQENVNAASNIYKPLVNDKSILKEIAAVKKGQASAQDYQSRANSQDEDVRQTANSYSDFLINYEMNKIASAKSQEELDAIDESNLNYVPATDYQKRFTEIMTKLTTSGGGGISKDNIESQYYLRTVKNGEQAKGPFTQLGLSMMTPEDIAYFQSAGKADLIRTRQGYIANGFTEQEANQTIVSDVMKSEYEKYNVQVQAMDEKISYFNNQIKKLESVPKGNTPEDEALATQHIENLKENLKRYEQAKTGLINERNNFDTDEKYKDLYQKKFDFYMARPEVGIGSNIAYRMASNIASSFAMSTAQESIKPNDTNLRLEEYKVKVMENINKQAAEAGKKKEGEGSDGEKETEVIPLGKEVFNLPIQKITEYVRTEKQRIVKESNGFGMEFTKGVISMLGNDTKMDFEMTDKLQDALSEGKGSEQAPQEMVDMFSSALGGGFTGKMTYGQLMSKINASTKKAWQTMSNDPDKVLDINYDKTDEFRQELENRELELQHIQVAENKISNDILKDEKYAELRVKDGNNYRLPTEDEYINKDRTLYRFKIKEMRTAVVPIGGYPKVISSEGYVGGEKEMTIGEAIQYAKENNISLKNMEYIDVFTPSEAIKDAFTMTKEGWSVSKHGVGRKYNLEETQTKFKEKYEKEVAPINEKIAPIIAEAISGASFNPTQKTVGFQYQKFKLPFSTKNNDILGEQVATMLTSDEFLGNAATETGIEKGDEEVFKNIMNYVRNNMNNLKAEDGSVEVSPVGKDGFSPQYKLAFSLNFLQQAIPADLIKNNQAIINKIVSGITVNSPSVNQRISSELSAKYSVISSVVSNSANKTYDYGKMDDNHFVRIQYRGNGSYGVQPFFLENGKPAKVSMQEVSKEKLDGIVKTLRRQIRNQFASSKQKAPTQTAAEMIKNGN